MKTGMEGQSVSTFGSVLFSLFRLPVFLGLVCYGLSTLSWLKVLTRVPLAVAYPTLSLGYIAIVGLSVLFLRETFRVNQVLGMMCIVVGVWILWR